ncbi:unnamed protein product [Triticum turgidum subsp. durum]|uniref:O-acyltransferase WSD1 C-terminal domain-containing protein n=1 Tax=Triticum turgidum subsp. durum TaxID=4567 RepID=A0A9R0R403_TRITD|nr:unnamed protein product [Triticum turgidum subsp. durum]
MHQRRRFSLTPATATNGEQRFYPEITPPSTAGGNLSSCMLQPCRYSHSLNFAILSLYSLLLLFWFPETVNDVLVGATSAALSQYYFRKSGYSKTGKLCLRSILFVNTRPTTSLQAYVNMIESGKVDDVAWGNQLGYILLPFHLAMHDDPLAYVCKAMNTVDRKKSSLEVIFTYKITEIFLKMLGLKAGAFIFKRMFANTTISFSNMAGPTEQIEFYGHPVDFLAPSVYGIPQALVVHYQSYNNTLKVILSVDEEVFPDYTDLLDDFVKSFARIREAASRLSTSIKKE